MGEQRGVARYQRLAASRLKAIRLMRGFTVAEMATGLTEALGHAVPARMLEVWESGAEPFVAGVLGAALDVTGVTEAEYESEGKAL